MPENPSSVSGVRQSPRSVRHASVTETVLYSFQGYPYDGAQPESGLTYFKGTLYGTTTQGGVYECPGVVPGCGTVYSITPSGTETVLHSFNGEDGENPLARMIVRSGTLYGTALFSSGSRCSKLYRCGTVFSITPSGHETVLHAFAGSPDGSQPHARLLNVNDTLYGTTESGGSHVGVDCSSGCGTVFSITPGGKEKVLYSFRDDCASVACDPDGAEPQSGLIDVSGTLYGTTPNGGANCGAAGCGTVFSITLGGKEKVLYSFYEGSLPSGLVDISGTLYGTTAAGGAYTNKSCYLDGCGTVFSITPSGKETVLHSFNGGDGQKPFATPLNVNGTLYGTTAGGGAYGHGTVFRITLSGRETVLYSFMGGQDGAGPQSGLIDVNGTLYGTTYAGGGNGCSGYGCGTVFSITL
jgi:uncharacterized repeat protein (TIGR03803 family)